MERKNSNTSSLSEEKEVAGTEKDKKISIKGRRSSIQWEEEIWRWFKERGLAGRLVWIPKSNPVEREQKIQEYVNSSIYKKAEELKRFAEKRGIEPHQFISYVFSILEGDEAKRESKQKGEK